jgi:hypothetical protein
VVSQNVLADAQFTLAAVLRPFDGFEFVYQGQAIFTPIAFPGVLDPDAGKPGFSPYLLKGLQVPMGAKVQLWFPAVVGLDTNQEGDPPILDYKYQLVWRLRNVGDFSRRQIPYHLSKESFGAPDTFLAGTAANPLNQFVLPASTETVVYQQPEPGPTPPNDSDPGPGRGNLRTDLVAVPSDLLSVLPPTVGLPLLPPNAAPNFNGGFPGFPTPPGVDVTPLGFLQQGIIDPRISNAAPGALFRPYFTIAKGDELIILAYRNNVLDGHLVWNFSADDFEFSNLYGTAAIPPSEATSHKPFPDLGIYVFTGSNPS